MMQKLSGGQINELQQRFIGAQTRAAILEFLTRNRTPMLVPDIAVFLGLSRKTVQEHVERLHTRGYVVLDNSTVMLPGVTPKPVVPEPPVTPEPAVVAPAPAPEPPAPKPPVPRKAQPLSPERQAVLDALRTGPMSMAQLAAALGKRNHKAAGALARTLAEAGLVERDGGMAWLVGTPPPTALANPAAFGQRRREAVLAALASGPLLRSAIAAAVGATGRGLDRPLNTLRNAGQIVALPDMRWKLVETAAPAAVKPGETPGKGQREAILRLLANGPMRRADLAAEMSLTGDKALARSLKGLKKAKRVAYETNGTWRLA